MKHLTSFLVTPKSKHKFDNAIPFKEVTEKTKLYVYHFGHVLTDRIERIEPKMEMDNNSWSTEIGGGWSMVPSQIEFHLLDAGNTKFCSVGPVPKNESYVEYAGEHEAYIIVTTDKNMFEKACKHYGISL